MRWSKKLIDQEGKLRLEMQTQYPYDNRVSIEISGTQSLPAKIRIRIPSWAARNMKILVNGRAAATGLPGTYVTLSRTWNTGDHISFEIPMEFRTTVYQGMEEGYDDGLHYIVQYGPVLLAAVNEKNPQRQVNTGIPESKLIKSLNTVVGKPLFYTIRRNSDFVFRPYFELQDELFTCYPAFTE